MTWDEQIKELELRAQVTYEQAKEALEKAGGSLVDALFLLEGKGVHKEVEGPKESITPPRKVQTPKEEEDCQGIHRALSFFLRILDTGNRIAFVAQKHGQKGVRLPLTALILLLWFLPWVSIPLLLLGFLFGLEYGLDAWGLVKKPFRTAR